MKTIGELQAAINRKDPNDKFEIHVLNNPEHRLTPRVEPEKIVILWTDTETLRLN